MNNKHFNKWFYYEFEEHVGTEDKLYLNLQEAWNVGREHGYNKGWNDALIYVRQLLKTKGLKS